MYTCIYVYVYVYVYIYMCRRVHVYIYITHIYIYMQSRQGFRPGEVRLRSLASAVRFYERIGLRAAYGLGLCRNIWEYIGVGDFAGVMWGFGFSEILFQGWG